MTRNQRRPKQEKETTLMKTKSVKTSIRGASVAVLVSASLLLLVAGTQGSRAGSNVGSGSGFPCTNGTLRGTYGIQMHGTTLVPPPVGGSQTVIGVVKRTFDGRVTSRSSTIS